jgi:hypothetical protein
MEERLPLSRVPIPYAARQRIASGLYTRAMFRFGRATALQRRPTVEPK